MRWLAACLVVLAALLPAAELRVSGIIGQSQPAEAPPLAALGFAGAAVDGTGRVWGAAGATLYAISRGSAAVSASVALPAGIQGQSALFHREGRLLAALGDGRLAVVDPQAARIERLLALPAGTTRLHCPARPGPGASRFAVVALAGRQLLGIGLDGAAPEPIAQVPELPGTWIEAIGVLAGGDVVVGTGYPDMRQYRFAFSAGHWQRGGGWPRPGWPRQYLGVGEATWMLGHDGAIALVDGDAAGRASAPAGTGQPHGGFAAGAEGWWIASARGLVGCDAAGRPVRRVGGLPGIDGVALAADGTVLALDGGQLVVRFDADGGSDAVPDSPANEPWRVGHGWSVRAIAMAGEHEGALLLDAAAGRIWRFEPARTVWGDRPWTACCPEGSLTTATALAVGDCLVRVIADGRVLEADRRTLPFAFRPLALGCAPRLIACEGDDRLVVAGSDGIAAFVRRPEGFVRQWSAASTATVAALAALPGLVAVAEAGQVRLLDGGDGRQLASLGVDAVPGHCLQPTALAARWPWILVADAAGRRVLRLRVIASP